MTWPSTHAAGTMGFLIDRIDDEIKRSGTVNDRIQIAIVDAINIYARERFRFNETFTATFPTVIGQQNYSVITDASFPSLTGTQQIYHIDWLTYTSGTSVFDVPRIQPEEILVLTQLGTQAGEPEVFAFMNETIMIYPVPSGIYPMSIGAHVQLPAPMGFIGSTGQDTTGNRWFTDGEKLIRSRAKYELAINVLRDQELAVKMSPHPPEQNGGVVGASWDAYDMLTAEMNRMLPRGILRPMDF